MSTVIEPERIFPTRLVFRRDSLYAARARVFASQSTPSATVQVRIKWRCAKIVLLEKQSRAGRHPL